MDRQQKELKVGELHGKFQRAVSAVVVDFTGTKVNDITAVRDKLRAKGVEYYVVKNTLARKAMENTNLSVVINQFKGRTGVAISFDDPSAPAKVLTDAAKDLASIKFKAAMVDGQRFGPEAMAHIAKLPSKDEIRAQLLATLQAPAQQLVGVLQAPLRDFALVLKAYEDKQNGSGNQE